MNVIEKADRAIQIIAQESTIAFDVETNGLDWKTCVPIGYVISSKDESVYIPIRHTGGGNLNNPTGSRIHPFEKSLAEALEARGKHLTVVGHNLKFDLHFAANSGIRFFGPLVCTQNTESLLNEYAKSYSLDSVALAHGVTPKLAEPMYYHLATTFGVPQNKQIMSHYHKLSGADEMAVDYAEGDGITTLELYEKQLAKIEEEDLDAVYTVENYLLPVLFDMERKGINVDTTLAKRLREELLEEVAESYDALPDGFNVRSPIQMKEYVSQFRTDWPTTPKGNPSFTESWLSTFEEGRRIVRVRKNTNLVNSFITPLLERHVFNGRVHPSFVQNKRDDGGTLSGRLACSSPNIQQVPKHDKILAPRFRKIFVADEGFLLSEQDYSQCEPRLFAHYSKDENLLEGYSQDPPVDVHSIVAEMFQLPRDTTAKRMNMGMFTGMYPKTFAEHMKTSVSEATRLRDEWQALFPGIAKFQGLAKAVIQQRGYVKTLLGRRGRLEHPRFAYRAVSKIIQGSNADILKYKMMEVHGLLKNTDGDLLATVHDSFLVQIPDSKEGQELALEVKRVCEAVQCAPFDLRVPFKIDMKTGRNWADASFS